MPKELMPNPLTLIPDHLEFLRMALVTLTISECTRWDQLSSHLEMTGVSIAVDASTLADFEMVGERAGWPRVACEAEERRRGRCADILASG